MKSAPLPLNRRVYRRSSKSWSASVAALAAAMLASNALPELRAASGSWQANPADQGLGVTVTVANGAFNLTDTNLTTPTTLVEGDAVRLGNDTGANLGTNFSYYYVVGVGATPSSIVRFSSSPSSTTFSPSGVPVAVTKVPTWFTTGNWSGNVVPNGIDDVATIAPAAPTAPRTAMTSLLLDRDVTVGSLIVDSTNCGPQATETTTTSYAPLAGSYGLSLLSASRTAGLLPTLTFKTSTGTPAVTLSGGNSFSFGETKIASVTPGNANAKLAVIGNQGLVINNLNPVSTPTAVDSRSPASTFPTYGVGPVRFGFGVDWSQFSGDLTLARGVFQPLGGGSTGNGFSSLPLNNKVILGTGTNPARMELPSTSANNGGSTAVRGLEGSNSSIINTRVGVMPASGGIGSCTFEVGIYSSPSDTYTYAGNIGDTTDAATVASVSAIRFVKIGPGTQILSGVNNLNALAANTVSVNVCGGTLSLGTTGAIGTITGGQGATNSDSSIMMKNGELAISGVGLGAPRSQAFGGFLIFGNVAANSTNGDANFSSQSSGFSTLTVAADPLQPATLTFGALKPRDFGGGDFRNLNGATMLYRGTNLGAAPIATPSAGTATILFTTAPTVGGGNLFAVGSGTLGTPGAAVLRGALADTSPTGRGAGFATYDSTNGVRLLNSAEQTTVSSGAAYDNASTTDNLVFNLTANESITGHGSNTLQIKNTSGLARTVTNTGTALNGANGMLFSGTDPIVLTGGQITGTTENDRADVIIHSLNTSSAGVTIQTPVSNFINVGGSTSLGWITYNGTGNFRLEGAQTVGLAGTNAAGSSFGGMSFNGTGTTTIAAPIVNASTLNVNQGIVKLDTGAAWSNVSRLLIAGGATFDFNGVSSSSTLNRFSDVIAPNTSVNGGLALNSGGVVTNSSSTPVELRLSGATNGAANAPFFGTITGNLSLVVDKSTFNSATSVFTYGTQALANVNTYTGETKILSGVLNVARGGQLPPTTVVTLGTAGSAAIATLSLGDSNNAGGVRQTIAGLLYDGTGASLVQNNGALPSQLTLNIASGENIYLGNLGVTPAANGSAQNQFGLRKTGAGTFEPAGAVNSYTGGTIIQGGVFRVSSDAKLGQIGSLTGTAGGSGTNDPLISPFAPISAFANNIVLDGGTLEVKNNPVADVILDAKRGIGMGPTSGSTGGTGGISVGAGMTVSYGGIIASAGNTGTQTFIKSGDGLLALNGNSTFTGVTQVAAGTLGGTGTLASGLSIGSGAIVAPGAAGAAGSGAGGIGTLTIGGPLTLSNGAVLNMELGAPGSCDKIQLGGGAVSATGTTTVNLTNAGGFGVGSYTLISGASAISSFNFVVGTIPSGYRGTFSTSGGSLVLTVAEGSQLSALESWRQTYFGSSTNTGNAADSADPDADGLSNLVEYATNTNPTVANSSVVTVGRSGSFLTLTYTRVADTTLTYTVEGSNDLGTWATVSTTNNPSTGAQNVAGQVTVTDTTAVTSRRFLRLKISY